MTTDVEVDQTECQESGLIGKSKNHMIYARFERKPPSRDEIRLLNPAIIDVRFPRQKSAK